MRMPSPPYCRLDLAPPLADRFIFGVAPIDYGPVLLLMPFGFHLAMDTLPSRDYFSGRRRVTAAFGYDAPHLSARGTSTLPNNALLSAHYEPLRHPTRPGLSLASCQWILIYDHRWGFPCCVWSPLPACHRHYPGRSEEACPLVYLHRLRPSL